MDIRQYFPKELRGSFNLRKPKGDKPTPIYFVCRFGKMQYKVSTEVKVCPRHWNPKTQEALISATLTELENRNNSIVNNVVAHIKICFAMEVEALLNECRNGVINENVNLINNLKMYIMRKIHGKETRESSVFEILEKCLIDDPIKESTKRPYRDAIKKFQEFVTNEKIELHTFNDITADVIKDYQQYLRNRKCGKRTKGGKLSVTHINKLVKTLLQRLDNYAVEVGLMDEGVLKKAKKTKPIKTDVRSGETTIALRDNEVIRLFRYHCKNQEQEDIKNLFCLDCCIGQRYSDLEAVNGGIKKINGHYTLQLKQKKNGSIVDVPLLFQMAEDIIKMYPNGLPTPTNNDMNKHIKTIAKEAGVGLELVSIPWQSGTESKPTFIETPRYSLITTHTARRTFITMLALRGKTSRFISEFSGHLDTEMVELYTKTTPAKRLVFEQTQREHPEMILQMISDKKPMNSGRIGKVLSCIWGILSSLSITIVT